jgi:AcrR family transcriptional regulator
MTSVADKSAERRGRDARASRLALLDASRELFDEQGYERATTREIGERAGVDPALIARYFGGKEELFLAAMAEHPPEGEDEVDYEPRALLAFMLERWEEQGYTPVSRALVSPSLDPEMGSKVSTIVQRRFLAPLVEELEAVGVADSGLRAEVFLALALGVAVTRANGTLPRLASSSREDVLAALEPLVEGLAR